MLEAKVSQSLVGKLVSLERSVAVGSRTLEFWRGLIDTHGAKKTEEFYLHIGLNHIEKKSVEWDGLNLSREPTVAEKLCVKSIANAQDASKESVGAILLKLRTELIGQGLRAIKKLASADYHLLILTAPKQSRADLRDEIAKVFMKGKRLVDSELSAQGKSLRYSETKQAEPTEDDDSELDGLTDLTDSRVANDVQSRITAAAQRFALLGLSGAALWKAVTDELNSGSVSYVDRAATGLANRVLNFGRYREMQDRKDEIGRYEYSAILDQNTCDPCAADDGKEADSPDDLPDTPNPDCAGSDFCRCFIVAIAEGVM